MQPWESLLHVARVVVSWHVWPDVEHTGSVLHVQLADPDGPVQLWCVPQAPGVPYAQQPLEPSVHVASLPEVQVCCPWAQLSVQVREHIALGAIPEHVLGLAQGAVDAT